jgi:hypothetical protein
VNQQGQYVGFLFLEQKFNGAKQTNSANHFGSLRLGLPAHFGLEVFSHASVYEFRARSGRDPLVCRSYTAIMESGFLYFFLAFVIRPFFGQMRSFACQPMSSVLRRHRSERQLGEKPQNYQLGSANHGWAASLLPGYPIGQKPEHNGQPHEICQHAEYEDRRGKLPRY